MTPPEQQIICIAYLKIQLVKTMKLVHGKPLLIEYVVCFNEFDIFGELNSENMLMITKSRCSQLSNRSFLSPGSEIAEILKKWTRENSSEPLRFVEPDQVDNLIKPQIDEAAILDNMKQIEERKVTASQLKRLYSIAKESGLTTEEAKAVIAGFGYQSSKDIPMSEY